MALNNKYILITSGPTSIPLDDMRILTNQSTGEMGRLLANALVKKFSKVTLLEGTVSTTKMLSKKVTLKSFQFFDDLDVLLKKELKKKPDIVIHAAAVSDFKLKKIFKGKISSDDKFTLDLIPSKKLILDIKKYAPECFLVGFKLESRFFKAVEAAGKLIEKAKCDLVVANTITGGYSAKIVRKDKTESKACRAKITVVNALVKELN